MNLIKYFSIFFILIAFFCVTSFSMSSKTKKAKNGQSAYSTSNEDLFWFTISVKIDERTDQYKLMGSGSKLSKGTETEFEREVWYGISRRQIVVGPFQAQNEAMNARMLYKKDEEKIDNIPSEDNPDEVYWFFVTFTQLERLGCYVFERMPAAVSSGSTTEFVDALYEGVTFKNLAIGPFWDMPNAEKSKALYRENE